MRSIIKSFLEHKTVQTVSKTLHSLYRPVIALWQGATAPLKRALSPVLEPARVRWAAFEDRFPLLARVFSWITRIFGWMLLCLLALILMVRLGWFGEIPDKDELRNIQTANASEVYTADKVLIGRFYIENRSEITLDKISPHVINALIATEDRRFLDHRGIDLWSWLRVGSGMLAGKKSMGGGSTLSQQLAKNLYPRRQYRIKPLGLLINKIRENIISIKLERVYSKDELLALYLNTVPFGGNVFGISEAAKQYFNKTSLELTPDQAATLIGMLKATTYYNPVRNPQNAEKRRNIVLRQMVRNNHLSEKEYEILAAKPVGAKRYDHFGANEGSGAYFREYLRTTVLSKILKDKKNPNGKPYNFYTDGLKIYTTLDSKMQQYAEQAAASHMAELQKQFNAHWRNIKNEKPWGDDKYILEQIKKSERWDALKQSGKNDEEAIRNFETPVKMTVFSWKNGGGEIDTLLSPLDSVRHYFTMLNCGFIALNHKNGHIKAWVGGINFKYFKYDHILSRRQVGSTFKPIVYAAALADSLKPCSYISNDRVLIQDWEPRNANESYGGYYSLAGALTNSVNVVAARLIERVGIQKTLDMARKMGVSATLPREFGISLGACNVPLYEMIQVYASIANKGLRPEPVCVTKILSRDGEVIFDIEENRPSNPGPNNGVQALSPRHAAQLTRMMQSVIDYGTGSRMRRSFGLTQDFAGKTGTTQNQSDGWFICFNPHLTTGAWVGGAIPAVRFRSMALGQGSAMALPIVGKFWHKLANDKRHRTLLDAKFEYPPTIYADFACPSWIDVSPDSLMAEIRQDSLLRDTFMKRAFMPLRLRPAESKPEPEEPTEGIPTTPSPAVAPTTSESPYKKLIQYKPEGGQR
ncbi:MAG: transglycosylase domain-containing protein [Saprospiraceae bacterium]